MPRKKPLEMVTSKPAIIRTKPAATPTAREQQMIGYAMDLAEKQLLDGTASAQVITHYLKLGTLKEKYERDLLIGQKKLMDARAENLESAKRSEEMYEKAIRAMQRYSGHANDSPPMRDED